MLKPEGGTQSAVLRLRDFRLFLSVRFLSSVAMPMQSVAVGWQVYDITGDPLSLGLVGLAQFLPMACLMLPAGDLADRYERRRILIVSYLVQAVCAAALLALTLTAQTASSLLFGVLMLFGVARALAEPPLQSFAPLLVPQAQFPSAVGWSSSANQAAIVIGPALGGALYIAGPEAVYGACLAIFLAMVAATAAIRVRGARLAHEARESMFTRVLAGIAYIRANRIILGAILLDLFAVLLGGATALLPVYARDILYVGPEGLGLLRSAQASGAVLMGLILANMPLRRHAGMTMLCGVAAFGVATIVFGLSESLMLSACALACARAARGRG